MASPSASPPTPSTTGDGHAYHLHEKRTLPYCADSVEFCPFPECFPTTVKGASGRDVFVCGNYELNEETKQKYGAIWLYRCDPDTKAPKSSPSSTTKQTKTMHQLQLLKTAAVFDLKWCPKKTPEGHALLAEAAADGTLSVYTSSAKKSDSEDVKKDEKNEHLSSLVKCQAAKEGKPALSLDWSTADTPPKICLSQGDKALSVWEISTELKEVHRLENAHDIDEIWACNFSRTNPDTLYSGGDDCKLKVWDLRTGACAIENCNHEAGVTVVSPHPARDHLLVTGSYDEHIRVYDTRNMYRALGSYRTGGGVWRLRWNSEESKADYLLAACMRAGFQVLTLTSDCKGLKLQYHCTAHNVENVTPLAYGCDWGRKDPDLIGSCSFYDKQLHLWSITGPGSQSTTDDTKS
mmetsp:Transcript_9377/g.23080  ORF Transcript_9377/g.23080 Transcript_9377/m.23080 type:complete len:407 (-) Transcript_9377:210-1430(-)